MNIDDLTIAQARELGAMFGSLTTPPTPTNKTERPVLVTTAHRGVFFGYATDTSGDTIRLRACRNAIYWSTAVRGFLGLASHGPDSNSRIGPPADGTVRAVTGVWECTPEAVEAWEAAPWNE